MANSHLGRSIVCLIAALSTTVAVRAVEPSTLGLDRNNSWYVEVPGKALIETPVFVTVRQVGQHWEIEEMFETPPLVLRSQKVELFVATRDLQRWSNFFNNAVANCDSIEAREDEFHSVCTSELSERKPVSTAMLGMLLGGNGKRPVVYNREKVAAAINSIPVEQATAALLKFEKREYGRSQ